MCTGFGHTGPVRCVGTEHLSRRRAGRRLLVRGSVLPKNRFSRARFGRHAPAVGQGLDEEEATAGLGVQSGVLKTRQSIAMGVGHFDAQRVGEDVHVEAEVTARDTTVDGGVRREFGDDLTCRVQGNVPGVQLLGREKTAEACPARRGRQAHAEVPDETVGLGLGGSGFVDHVTQSGEQRLP